jgi:hypothetical protein
MRSTRENPSNEGLADEGAREYCRAHSICGAPTGEGDRMVTRASIAPALTRVAVAPHTTADEHYRAGREAAARAGRFPARPDLNLHDFGGKTIEQLVFTHVYLGSKSAWPVGDAERIDAALSAAMTDPHLNNVLAQYYRDGKPTSAFRPSRTLEGPVPARVYRDTVEGFVSALDQSNGLSSFDLSRTVFCFLLPPGVVLVDGDSTGHQQRHDDDEPEYNPALAERDEAVDSRHGLGGYHGSVHPKHGDTTDTVYYAVGVYSEGGNGIVAFDQPWENICATFYHELCEARTDPDVEDAIRAGDTPGADKLLGWYSPHGGEIGDIPMEEAGADLSTVMKEVSLAGGGTAPIQLMWSNAVGGPEGPIAHAHAKGAQHAMDHRG